MLPFANICRGPRVVVLFYCLRQWESVVNSLRLPLVILTAAIDNINVDVEDKKISKATQYKHFKGS